MHYFRDEKFADIDECSLGRHNCEANEECVNSPGSFRCLTRTCPSGYKMNDDTGVCDPVVCARGLRADASGNCIGKTILAQHVSSRESHVMTFVFRHKRMHRATALSPVSVLSQHDRKLRMSLKTPVQSWLQTQPCWYQVWMT